MCCSATVSCGRRRAVPNEERRLRREGFLNYERVSILFRYDSCELVHLVLEHSIKRLNDACRMPPFRWFDSISDSSHVPASLCLFFAYWAEPTRRESFFELANIEATTSDAGRERLPEKTYEGILWSG